jgi:hypothetical protein
VLKTNRKALLEAKIKLLERQLSATENMLIWYKSRWKELFNGQDKYWKVIKKD